MPRNLLIDRDEATGFYRHRYGDARARVVVVKRTEGLTAAQLEDLDATLDLVLEDERAAEQIVGVVNSPLVYGIWPPQDVVRTWVDTRTRGLH